MIDRELIQWAVQEAAADADSTPDVDIKAVMTYAAHRARNLPGDVSALGVDPDVWLAGTLAHMFMLGIACGRAEIVDTEEGK